MANSEDKLVIVWSSGDRYVALRMVFMYTLNAKLNNWWDDITFIIWGPSADLVMQDMEIQENLLGIKEHGVKLEACISCADMYGISDDLRALGIDVKKMGTVLTDYIKEGRKVITF